jgi:hypothetical protein
LDAKAAERLLCHIRRGIYSTEFKVHDPKVI